QDADGESSPYPLEGGRDGRGERDPPGQGRLDEMGDHLGIGFRGEAVTVRLELRLQLQIVLQDAVVNDGEASAAVAMGVSIVVRWAPVGCPARVPEAYGPAQRFQEDETVESVDAADASPSLEARGGLYGEPRGVIAAVLEPARALEKDH